MTTYWKLWALTVLLLSGCARTEPTIPSTQHVPAKSQGPPPFEFRENHDPNGIGKFYMDREIAQVMGHEAEGWLDRPEREQEERSSLLLDALELKPGLVVADIGAGSGYLTFPMAERVAPGGKVLAVDIQQEMLDLISQRMKQKKLENVVPLLGKETDPLLPEESVDLILLVDVYHEFSEPYAMTVNMLKGLKPGGRLVFVEFRMEDESVPIKLVHKMTESQVKKEMAIHPLKHVKTVDILPWQYIIIFEKM
jgi:precorrin-6B methylase 2